MCAVTCYPHKCMFMIYGYILLKMINEYFYKPNFTPLGISHDLASVRLRFSSSFTPILLRIPDYPPPFVESSLLLAFHHFTIVQVQDQQGCWISINYWCDAQYYLYRCRILCWLMATCWLVAVVLPKLRVISKRILKMYWNLLSENVLYMSHFLWCMNDNNPFVFSSKSFEVSALFFVWYNLFLFLFILFVYLNYILLFLCT